MSLPNLFGFLDFRKLMLTQLQDTEPAEPAILQTLLELKNQVTDSIYIVTMGFGENASVSRQLQQLQRELVLLSNEFFALGKEENPSEFCLHALSNVVELLDKLERHNTMYFDVGQPIPLYLAAEAMQVLNEKLPLLQSGLKNRKISIDLQQVVLLPFLNLDITYLQMRYLLKHIDTFISHLREASDEESLIDVLLRSGLNTASFNQYFTQKITKKVKANLSVNCQLEVLYDYQRLLCSVTKKPRQCYDFGHPSSRETVLKFVNAEINCLHNKQQLSIPKAEVARVTDYHIKTSLSVDGFAYLLRLLVEAEVIEANPRTQLIAFMASNVQTRGKGEGTISADSLATKYRQVNQNTAVGVRSLLVKMAKQAQDSFNI